MHRHLIALAVAVLVSTSQAETAWCSDVPLSLLVYNFRVVEGAIVWDGVPPPHTDTALVEEFWRVWRRNARFLRGMRSWESPLQLWLHSDTLPHPGPAGVYTLQIDILDLEMGWLSCQHSLPLAASAKMFLEALGCVTGVG